MSESELIDPVSEPDSNVVNLAEPIAEGSQLKTIDDPLVKENFEQGLEIARLTDQLEKLRAAHGIQTQIVTNQEADIKTLKENLNMVTQSFNVCRSMLIHIGAVMGDLKEKHEYIKALVDSPAIQTQIGTDNAQAG